jgi:predicted metalloprotease
MGHAVASEMGVTREISLLEETSADCMAGVITYLAQRDRHLDKDDIQEANYALTLRPDSPDLTFQQQLATPENMAAPDSEASVFRLAYIAETSTCV